MNNVAVKTELVKKALKLCPNANISFSQKKNVKNTLVPLTDSNKNLLEFMSENIPLTKIQKEKIIEFLFASDKLGDTLTVSVVDFFKKINRVNGSIEPLFEIKITDKWYPVLASCSKYKTFTGSEIVELSLYGRVGTRQYNSRVRVGDWEFFDDDDQPLVKTINNLLKKSNVRVASKESLAHAKKLNEKLLEFNFKEGQVYDADGPALAFNDYWGWENLHIGSKNDPAIVVIEPKLEDKNEDYYSDHEDGSWHLPFVRIFSFKHKNYMYVDIENMQKHFFHRDGKSKIILPPNMFAALESIFNSNQKDIFGDIFHGRHGGIVVLANGPSGVGKTLSAEVFAEYQERPLYCMEMSEIGTNVKEVEKNLSTIFARAKKWNAVLLFDEADIFLSERVASDLERSAIVGIFLRLLDYYEGTFFLTTNRGEGIDKAFKSRVTLYLNYPELSPETRQTIWTSMLESAGIKVEEVPIRTWFDIINVTLNGRQIRNQVRLLKLMYPNNKLTTRNIYDSLSFAAI